jgi:tetratricopeptide (TPR) repeat protein
VTYDSVLKRDRRAHHQKIGDWLATKIGTRATEYLGLIADHYERAGDTVKAAPYLRRAAEDAAQRYAHNAALDYLNRALALTPETDIAGRFALLLAREAIFELQGARPAQNADLDALATLADQLNDDALRAEVAGRRTIYCNRVVDYEGAIQAAQHAVMLAEAANAPAIALRASNEWGWALMSLGEYATAQERMLLNLDQARRTGDSRAEANTLKILGVIGVERGNVTARAYLEQALQLHQAIGDRRTESVDLHNLAICLHALGDYPAALKSIERSLTIHRETGDRLGEGISLAVLGSCYIALGENEIAVTHARQGLAILRTIGHRQFEGVALTVLGHALAELGRTDEAEENYRTAIALLCEMGLLNIATSAQAGLARVALGRGNLDGARAHVESILTHFAAGGFTNGPLEPLRVYLTCYQVLAAARDPRADSLLATAHAMLEERAAKITDPEMQRRFREDIPYHREIASAWLERQRAVTAATDS